MDKPKTAGMQDRRCCLQAWVRGVPAHTWGVRTPRAEWRALTASFLDPETLNVLPASPQARFEGPISAPVLLRADWGWHVHVCVQGPLSRGKVCGTGPEGVWGAGSPVLPCSMWGSRCCSVDSATLWAVSCQAFLNGIVQARVLEWVAISFSRGSSQPRDQTCVSCIGRRVL